MRTESILRGSGLESAPNVVQKHSLRFVIATVPDPVRSTNSHRFDEWIDSIQRAYESEGFLLSGFRMPWGSRAISREGGPDRPQRKTKEPKAGGQTRAGSGHQARKPAATCPGP